MRQVFTSQRIETVEGVAKLLIDAGIEVYISNGRSYHSKRGSQFSYTEPTPQGLQPALWVRHAEDQPRAREILRAGGLLETTRPGNGPSLTFTPPADEPSPRRSWAWRLRLVLLALIALAAAVMWMRRPAPPPAVPATPQEQPVPPAADPAPAEEETERVRIQPATG